MEIVIRIAMGNDLYFGGKQVVFVGDPKQLPPVKDELYLDDGKYCWESDVWKSSIRHAVCIYTTLVFIALPRGYMDALHF